MGKDDAPKDERKANRRGAARLAAVQALYQQEMEGTPTARLIHEFHDHRLGATIEGETYADAEISFFDDLVEGTSGHTGVSTGANDLELHGRVGEPEDRAVLAEAARELADDR